MMCEKVKEVSNSHDGDSSNETIVYNCLYFISVSEDAGHHLPLQESGLVVDQINPVEQRGNVGEPDV